MILNEIKMEDTNETMMELIIKSLEDTHMDISKLIYFILRDEFRCVSTKENMWYQYENNRWRKDRVNILKKRINDSLEEKYSELECKVKEKKMNEQTRNEIMGKIKKIKRNIKMVQYQDQIIKECGIIFINNHDGFEEELDMNPNILGFENGVVELKENEIIFRKGKPSDKISKTTGYSYLTENNEKEEETLKGEEEEEGIVKQIGKIQRKKKKEN